MIDWPTLFGSGLLFVAGAATLCVVGLGIFLWWNRKID